MRHKPKWIIGATIPIAAGSLAAMVAGALPAMAQQPNCHHHAPASKAATTVQAVTTVRCALKIKLATPVKVGGKVTIVGDAGKTTAAPDGVAPVATGGKVCPAQVTLSTAKAVKAVPVIVGQGGTTAVAPS